MSTTPTLAINNLLFSYTGANDSASKAPLLDIPQWSLGAGETAFLAGRSGSGKSTLLHLLVGLLAPTRGSIEVLGTDLSSLSAGARDQFRAAHIGVVFQQLNLIPYLSVLDNVRLATYFAGTRLPEAQLQLRYEDLMNALQLPLSLSAQPAQTLSVGQQQRVAIARALINRPQLLIADEPTSALDEDATQGFMQVLLAQCRAQGSALLFVSHDKRLESHFDTSINLHCLNKAANSANDSTCGQIETGQVAP